MTSQSRQSTAFHRGRTPASRFFLVSADIYITPCAAAMWAAIGDKNTASWSMCKLSKLSAHETVKMDRWHREEIVSSEEVF
jgi:hypothetical protein